MDLYISEPPQSIALLTSTGIKNKFATMNEIESINQKVMEEIDECVRFADESPYPDPSDIYADVYMQKDYPYLMD